jgi:transposase
MASIVPDRVSIGHEGRGSGDGVATYPLMIVVEYVVAVVSADPIELSRQQRVQLLKLVRAGKTPQRLVLRARIVLLAADGHPNAVIAARVGVCDDTARKWRRRYRAHGLKGLADAPRPGRPPLFTPVQVAEVKALACQLPAEAGVPLSVWSCPELAREAVDAGVVDALSASTVRRWLAADAIKPWQHRSWIFPRDPDLRARAARVLDLYAGVWEGRPLGPGEYVISSDEKTSIQARCRCHPTLPPGKARMMRINHDYKRGGALAYLAAYDVHRAQVFGQCAASSGIEPFMALAEHVMTQEPYASAKRVFWIVDNAPPTGARPRSTGWPSVSPTRSWCIPRSTPPG